jgi:paraquat-inducible protein A
MVLSAEGMSPVALLVLATTILFPLLQLCILAYLLMPLSREHRPWASRSWCGPCSRCGPGE